MDVFLYIGIPFAALLIPIGWAAYGIGGSGADPFAKPVRPTVRARVRRAVLVLVSALVAGLGAAAAASAGAFDRTTNAGLAVEPAALLFALEAAVDVALAAVVALPGWSNRRAWALRMAGVYWLCLAAPIWILADAGPGWLSTGSDGIFFLGLPAFVWEMTAALLPLVLLSIAAGGGSAAGAAGPDAGTDLRPDAGPNAAD